MTHVLLSNDDGIDSPSLNALADALAQTLGYRVTVMAPERQRSAMSHTITLHKPLRINEVAPGRYSVSGSPVDCVYVGVMKICDEKPDLVISGINDGYNLGTDVFYSGTVGAAMEGGLRDIPSLAVSMTPRSPATTDVAVKLTLEVAQKVLALGDASTVFNVNVPEGASELRWTRLGRRFYDDDIGARQDPRGRNYYWIGGGEAGARELAGSDCEAVYAGHASITPLGLDPTRHDVLAKEPAWDVTPAFR